MPNDSKADEQNKKRKTVMFKMEVIETGKIIKSYDIQVLWDFIMENKSEYQFYVGYTPLSYDEFLRYYLHETKDYQNYLKLFEVLKRPLTIQEIIEQWKKNEKL